MFSIASGVPAPAPATRVLRAVLRLAGGDLDFPHEDVIPALHALQSAIVLYGDDVSSALDVVAREGAIGEALDHVVSLCAVDWSTEDDGALEGACLDVLRLARGADLEVAA